MMKTKFILRLLLVMALTIVVGAAPGMKRKSVIGNAAFKCAKGDRTDSFQLSVRYFFVNIFQ